jgi:hypothetical protein
VALATVSAIRDRARVLVGWIDPVSLTSTRFRDSRNELRGDFREWAEKNSAAALRRYQIRDSSSDSMPLVSNTVSETHRCVLEVIVAYPQTNRAGDDNAMDRDRVIDEDWDYICFNLGHTGRSQFSGTYDCTPLGFVSKTVERGEGCDFLVAEFEYEYQRALAIGGLAQGLGG